MPDIAAKIALAMIKNLGASKLLAVVVIISMHMMLVSTPEIIKMMLIIIKKTDFELFIIKL